MTGSRQELVGRAHRLERMFAKETADLDNLTARREPYLGWMESLHDETGAELAEARAELAAWDGARLVTAAAS